MKSAKVCNIPFMLANKKRPIVGDCSPTLFLSSSNTSVSEIESSQNYSLKNSMTIETDKGI